MSNILPFAGGKLPFDTSNLPSVFRQVDVGSELSENVGSAFAVVSIKGKAFRIRHNKVEHPLTVVHQGTTYASPFLDCIIIRGNAHLSKTYYKDSFREGSNEQPDCFSEDGVRPMVSAPVHAECATCPMNIFGSKVSDNGSRGKACQDTRKLAITFADDIDNEKFGGVMLLRVPPASLRAVAEYEKNLRAAGVPYCAVVTRISFDAATAHPQLVLTPLRVLTEEEGAKIAALRDGPHVADVLASGVVSAPAPAPAATLPAGITASAVPSGLTSVVQAPAQTPPPAAYAAPAQTPPPAAYAAPVPAAPPAAYAAPAPAPATYAPPAAQAAPPQFQPPPAAQAAPPQFQPPPGVGAAPPPAAAAGGVPADAAFLSDVDRLLGG